MVKIDPTYDVVLTYSPIIEITGHIFECFDYYLFLRQYCKAGILFFQGLKLDKLKIAFESKYNVSFDSIVEDIIKLDSISCKTNKQIIQFGKDTKVVLADGNIKSLQHNNIVLATKQLYGFMCEYEDFHDMVLNKHITYLQDYRIYGKNKYFKSIDYVKKLPFKFYKTCSSPNKNIGLMYMTYVCRKVSPNTIKEYYEKSGCAHTLLVVPYKLPEYDCIAGITQIEAPLEDFFNRFDTYIYTPVNRKFDCSSRMLVECFMHNKKVYKDLDYFDVALETRLNDCKNDLQSLNLDKQDAILDILNLK